MHNSLVDGDDQGSCQKTFSEKKTVVDFLEDKQLASTQLQWTYFISLYPLHLDPDGKGLRLWCSEVITALEGQAHKKHFQKETAKIQGCSVQLLDSFFFYYYFILR